MNVRALWTAVRRWYGTHSARDRRILLGVTVAVGLSLVYVAAVEPLLDYRGRVAEEIAEGQEGLERSARFVGAAEGLRAERQQLRQRLEEAKTRLLPGDSGTLGAAALQERANAIAASKGITVQSVQVMREEAAEPFRKVAIRLTLSGELRPFAEFVSGLEYGPQQLTIPFAEVSRRGAVAGAKGPRALTATVELAGYLQPAGSEAKTEGDGVGGDGVGAEPEAAAGEAEAGSAPAEGEGAAVVEPGREVPPAEAALPAAPPATPPQADTAPLGAKPAAPSPPGPAAPPTPAPPAGGPAAPEPPKAG